MKILLTGATGRIGKFVHADLIEKGYEVITTTRSRHKSNDAVRHLDLTAEIDPAVVEGIDAVVHLAGIADRRSGASPADFQRVNCDATIELAEAAKATGVSRFVFASTIFVHGDSSKTPITMTSHLHPTDVYSLSKAAAEEALRSCSETSRTNIDILRLAAFRATATQPSELAERIVELIPVIPVPLRDNRRSTASPAAVARSVVFALNRPLNESCVIGLVADGESGFRSDIHHILESGPRRRFQLPLPDWVWTATDRALSRVGGPSLAGMYADLRIQDESLRPKG